MVARESVRSTVPGADEVPPKGTSVSRVSSSGDGSGQAPELDSLIHEKVRLGIVSALAANDTLTFRELKELMRTTDGNISVHARRLEDASYIECMKSFQGRIPRTSYRLTAEGRRALERYLDHMEALIRAARVR
jgi:DNA-binding transcriptional ArsR family regulator